MTTPEKTQPDPRRKLLATARRIVVKVGTSVICDDRGLLDARRVARLTHDVERAREAGREVVVVSSGGIGAGMAELGLERRPDTLPRLQAAAAVGQSKLMNAYDHAFRVMGVRTAQVLLTREDIEDRTRYLNARNTIRAILEYGAVPIINENDTTSTEEITFGENDVLSALVTNLIQAELLVILSTVPGLMRDYGARKDGRVVSVVEAIDDGVLALDAGTLSAHGTGGMASKLRAARISLDAGEPVVIADGTRRGVLMDVLRGADVGTLFLPRRGRLAGRKRWIGFSARSRGTIRVDAGAARALLERGKSLLATGVTAVEGAFGRGDAVNICDDAGRRIARGLVNYSSEELDRIKGLKTSAIASVLGAKPYDEVVHRDNLVLL